MNNHELLEEIKRRIEAGELSRDDAVAAMPKRGRGRPRTKPAKAPQPIGAPPKREIRLLVFASWALYHDKMPRQKLRELLADALAVDISVIARHIARLNKLAKNPKFVVARNSEQGTVILMTKTELRRAMMRERRGIDPFADMVMLDFSDSAKTPEK